MLDFSGWNWVANTLPVSTAATTVPPYSHVATTASGSSGIGGVGVDEVHPRLVLEPVEHRRRPHHVEDVPLHLRPLHPVGQQVDRPGDHPQPAASGSSSERSNSSCMPTQIPRNGLPERDGIERGWLEAASPQGLDAPTERTRRRATRPRRLGRRAHDPR